MKGFGLTRDQQKPLLRAAGLAFMCAAAAGATWSASLPFILGCVVAGYAALRLVPYNWRSPDGRALVSAFARTGVRVWRLRGARYVRVGGGCFVIVEDTEQ